MGVFFNDMSVGDNQKMYSKLVRKHLLSSFSDLAIDGYEWEARVLPLTLVDGLRNLGFGCGSQGLSWGLLMVPSAPCDSLHARQQLAEVITSAWACASMTLVFVKDVLC